MSYTKKNQSLLLKVCYIVEYIMLDSSYFIWDREP